MRVSRFGLVATMLLVPANLGLAYIKVERGSGSFPFELNLTVAAIAAIWSGYQLYIIWSQKRAFRRMALKGANDAGKAILTNRTARRTTKEQIKKFGAPSAPSSTESGTDA
ncbi:MAG: hypothetical protein VR75_08505 [Hyphomonadaceae bacterium BRH_c29]|nr:MAG: hypothetical protein VR75_08505 [Hyphomonadaceae bacterium BRH_c29]